MGSGYSKMKKQAKMMEQQLSQIRTEMKTKIFHGSAGNGLVTIELNGNKEAQKVTIQPACVDKEDIEGLQDLILAAFQDACNQVEAANPQNPSDLASFLS